jgi:cell wall-associated NlpC family hydrolase
MSVPHPRILAALCGAALALSGPQVASASDAITGAEEASVTLAPGEPMPPGAEPVYPNLPLTLLATAPAGQTSLPVASAGAAHSAVGAALTLIGVHYRRGGETPQTGLDCSGLVRYVYHEAMGLDLPRRALEMSRLGIRVARDQLRPGDLIFFNTLRRVASHVGIYIGDGRFVHAPTAGGTVRVESLEVPYWTTRFNAARRIEE